jgi:hypothetical protein
VNPDRLIERNLWVAEYERSATAYAACHFLESLGTGRVHPEIGPIVELHDREARANDLNLSIA